MGDQVRQTGYTTRQIIQAPQKAVFVCSHHQAVYYTRSLAHYLGRTDLTFVTPYDIEYKACGTDKLIVVDHAVTLSCRQWSWIKHWNALRLNDKGIRDGKEEIRFKNGASIELKVGDTFQSTKQEVLDEIIKESQQLNLYEEAQDLAEGC